MGKNFDQIVKVSKALENHKLTLAAAEEVTYIMRDDGTDSASSPFTI